MSQISEIQKANIGKAIAATTHPRISAAIALAGLANHYVKSPVSLLVGGLTGLIIGGKIDLDDNIKANTIGEVLASRQQIMQDLESESGDRVSGIMNSGDLLKYKYDKYNFSGKWAAFLGSPSRSFHAMIYGRPKQGKSILSVQFAQYLSENFGKVLYIASEEGFSVTLQKKIAEFAMNNSNLDFANFRDFNQIRSALIKTNYAFVFIDSVNFIKITPEDVEDLKHDNPNTAFITVQQATKNGNFRGSQEFAHNCDIVIRVEAGQASQQGRFQEPSEMAVFDKPEGDQNKTAPQMGAVKMEHSENKQNDPNYNEFDLESNF